MTHDDKELRMNIEHPDRKVTPGFDYSKCEAAFSENVGYEGQLTYEVHVTLDGDFEYDMYFDTVDQIEKLGLALMRYVDFKRRGYKGLRPEAESNDPEPEYGE